MFNLLGFRFSDLGEYLEYFVISLIVISLICGFMRDTYPFNVFFSWIGGLFGKKRVVVRCSDCGAENPKSNKCCSQCGCDL